MKILFIATLFISNFCFSQARELSGNDTTSHRPGVIYKDTIQTIQADSPIVVTKVSPYKIKFSLSGGFTGGNWTKSALYPSEIYVGASPSTINRVSIGIDDSIAPLHISRAIAVSSIDTGLVISNPTVATASNSTYSPAIIEKAIGNNTTYNNASIRHYVGTSSTGTYQTLTYYWDGYNQSGSNWINLLKFNAVAFGGGTPYGSLVLGGPQNVIIQGTRTGGLPNIIQCSDLYMQGTSSMKLSGNTAYLWFPGSVSYGQVYVPTGLSINNATSAGTVPDSSALLDLASTTKGLYLPRLTTNQRDSLTSSVAINPTITNAGSGYVNGSYVVTYTTTTGSGSGLKGTVVVSGGVVASAGIINNHGLNYAVGDQLTVPNTSLGGSGSGLVLTVTKVGVYAANVTKGLMIYNINMNRINTWDGTQWNYEPQISIGTAAPATTPLAVGDEFVDTANKKIYFATGTSSSTDWIITN